MKLTDEATQAYLRANARALRKARFQNGAVRFSYINWDNGFQAGYRAALNFAIRVAKKGGRP